MANSELDLGDWTADPAANELRHRSGRRVRCEARTMKVLELLHARRGTVVPTGDILDGVWGRTAVSPHSVAVVISDLRRLLGDSAKSPHFIETVPKRGYRLLTEPAAAPHRRRLRSPLLAGIAVVGVLGILVGLGADSFVPQAPHGSADLAFQAKYFQARQLWSRREAEDVRHALSLLEEVIAERGDFAPAHAALADIYAHKTGEELGLPALDAYRAAQRHLDRAMALDPAQAEPYVTQALLDFYRDRQPRKALGSLDEAVRRDPRLALAWQTRGMVLSAVGEHAASLAAIERARGLDPLSISIGWDEVWFLYLAGENERALAALEHASEHSRRNYLYEALIEQVRGRELAALALWLRRFEQKDVALKDPEIVQRLAESSPPQAYAELARQAARLPDYREYSGVLAAWQLLGGDAEAALATLAADPGGWMQIWLHEMPVFAPLLPRAEMEAIVRHAGIAGN